MGARLSRRPLRGQRDLHIASDRRFTLHVSRFTFHLSPLSIPLVAHRVRARLGLADQSCRQLDLRQFGGEEETAGLQLALVERAVVFAGGRQSAGSHHLVASVPGGSAVRRRIEVAEAGSESITLELSPLDASGTSGARGVGAPPPGGGSSRQTWGWVATGVGLAGVATGIGFGIAAQNKRADLEGACSGGRCPPSREETLDAFRTQRTVAWVGYGVGAAGFASAAVLFFVLPDDRPTTGFHTWVGPGSAGVAGGY